MRYDAQSSRGRGGGGWRPLPMAGFGVFGLCNTQNFRGCCLESYLFIRAAGLHGLSDLTMLFTQLTATK